MPQQAMSETLPSDIEQPTPTTPRKARNRASPETPNVKTKASPGNMPRSAPAAANGLKRYDTKKHHEATLLSDFFQGKQTAARVAADRRRRRSLDAVKAELRAGMRHEMKQDSVRKLQQPGRVRERVQAWQRNNVGAMAGANPNYAATEPDDMAFDGQDLESVTEEDRMRIKLRQKKEPYVPKAMPNSPKYTGNFTPARDRGAMADDAGIKPSASPPKKRVVSDSNWMRQRPKKPTFRELSPSIPKMSSPGKPKGFVLHPTPNPPVSSKIKAWVAKIETPDEYESGFRIVTATTRASRPKQGHELCSEERTDLSDSIVCGDETHSTSSKDFDLRNDGIRVRPITTGSDNSFPDQTHRTPHQSPNKSITGSSKSVSGVELSYVSVPSSQSTRKPARRCSKGISNQNGDSKLYTPTKSKLTNTSVKQNATQSFLSNFTAQMDGSSRLVDEVSESGTVFRQEPDIGSNITAKTLADIPDDIPFGHSAFSELDLTAGGVGRYRPKKLNSDRKPSFKGMPHVFKKVMDEGKKLIKDMNEPPRPHAPNKPPSIEKWLNTTVDPFVETAPRAIPTVVEEGQSSKDESNVPESTKVSCKPQSSLHRQSPTKVSAADSDTKDVERLMENANGKSAASEKRKAHTAGAEQLTKMEFATDKAFEEPATATEERCVKVAGVSQEMNKKMTEEVKSETRKEFSKEAATKRTSLKGLQRAQARRSANSPLKGTRKDFFGVFKGALSGESNTLTEPLRNHKTGEPQPIELADNGFREDVTDAPTLSTRNTKSMASDQRQSQPKMCGYRSPPPTNGHHELSTIASDDSSSAVVSSLTGSGTTSRATQSTLTQSTIISKSSQAFSKKRPNFTKGKLTSHSDLMSVLSLPDQAAVPQGMRNRSRPSLRRRKGVPAGFTEYDLLEEFALDEDLYSRELKTLVDGVIPVLLADVIDNNNTAALVFFSDGGTQTDVVSNAVVGMGLALEKIRSAHKKAPTHDLRRLVNWARGVVPKYNKYLNAWRLGFQDLVVNLAPAAGKPNDDDSLLDALPRDENGDVINAKGERVAVAYLLKRPLVRIKQMAKLIKCVESLICNADTVRLLHDFEDLLEKCRRRHREETARVEDEDAFNTDVAGCRDIRTLAAVTSSAIDASLQVNAKDTFSLSLMHSSGQRLDCQVELVYRDNPLKPEDKGDLLIRDPGNGKLNKKPALLFPPISMDMCSARTGDGNFDMVIMLRGTYQNRTWHELLLLTADDEDQVLDWLDLLPLSPVPPREPEPSVIGDDEIETARNVPVGVGRPITPSSGGVCLAARAKSPLIKNSGRLSVPVILQKVAKNESSPASPIDNENGKESARARYYVLNWDDGSHQERDLSLPECSDIKKPYSAKHMANKNPPPPVHRSLPPIPADSKCDSTLLAPPESSSDGVRRRRSSPLKHEYLPSDVSSGPSSASASANPSPENSENEFSDDDVDSIDIPETELGICIANKQHPVASLPVKMENVLSQSSCSVRQFNPASRACGDDVCGVKRRDRDSRTLYAASLSRWSDRGAWMDVAKEVCTIAVSAGVIEAFAIKQGNEQGEIRQGEQPILALDLTPLVLIRQSTVLDLEVRSSVQLHSRLYKSFSGGNFRFRCRNAPECYSLYLEVHQARLSNQRFIQLENDTRFRNFGERAVEGAVVDSRAGRRSSWFWRRNSYSPRT